MVYCLLTKFETCLTQIFLNAWQISDKLMKPIPIVMNILTKVEDIIPKWKIVPTNNIIDSAFKDRSKREAVRFMWRLIRMTERKSTYITYRFHFLLTFNKT